MVATLKTIEMKVADMIVAFGPMPVVAPVETVLLNGPQLPANAMAQTEIDKLLASFD